jgi:hypothetical protein
MEGKDYNSPQSIIIIGMEGNIAIRLMIIIIIGMERKHCDSPHDNNNNNRNGRKTLRFAS